ncbi:hypothetical protein D3C85_167200 [compost metagenome]
MGFQTGSGLNVSNWYGARDSGGTQGVYKTEGYYNEFVWELAGDDLPVKFPTNVEVIGVDETFSTGTDITALTIGGVAVIAATEAAPVGIVAANTGVLAKTGGTAGYVIIKYKTAPAGVVVA